jgi:hypothetical protein
LVIDATDKDADSVVGDECHIISGQESGPRHGSNFPTDLIDEPENLILLCKIHHKQIDDQYETYSVDLLRMQKTNHEKWVSETLTKGGQSAPIRIRRIKENIPPVLVRITSGKDVMHILDRAVAFSFDNDVPNDPSEMELLSGFLQELQDWGDVSSDLDFGDRVRAGFRISELLKEVEAVGFWLFGAREIQRLEGGIAEPSPFPVAILRVLRSSNPEIQSLNPDSGETVRREKDSENSLS